MTSPIDCAELWRHNRVRSRAESAIARPPAARSTKPADRKIERDHARPSGYSPSTLTSCAAIYRRGSPKVHNRSWLPPSVCGATFPFHSLPGEMGGACMPDAKPAPIIIPTEPIGSIPRPRDLVQKLAQIDSEDPALASLYEDAVRDTIERFEATGSPVVTDGEQKKYHNFLTYCVHGLPNTSTDGFKIPFSDGHTRRMLRLTRGPFRYMRYADSYLDVAMRYAHVPVKQAVISPSALSLMYPAEGIPDYPREQFIEDLLREHETEIRRCLQKGAHKVQIDFTEGRLAMKIDPSGQLLDSFIDLNNLALSRFSPEERSRIRVHTCPGGDFHATHSADVDYANLLPGFFELKAGNFYVALAGEQD